MFNDQKNLQKVLEASNVQLSVLLSDPPILSILAFGATPTPGWSNAVLIPYVYLVPPADGIYEFDFAAQPPPPDEVLPQVKTPIVGGYLWRDFPGDALKGVRIYACSNAKEVLLTQEVQKFSFVE